MNTTALTTAIIAGMTGAAIAGPMPFSIFENADGVSTSHLAIGIDAYESAGSIDFVITNNSAGPGVLTSVIIENTATSSSFGSMSIIGQAWSADANANVPGSIHSQGAWAGSLLGVIANPSRIENGLSAGESLTLRFDLNGTDFADAYAAFIDREFRFVGHIQSIGASSVWGVNVPAPASLAMLGAGGLVASRRRR